MSYVVVWNLPATESIDSAWLKTHELDRPHLESVVFEAERQLRVAPLEVGESRGKLTDRVLLLPPLTLFYRVVIGARMVHVAAACVYRSA